MKQLLIKLKEAYKTENDLGLCHAAWCYFGHYSYASNRLCRYIQNNTQVPEDEIYVWPVGLTEPRIEWLDKHIKLND